MMMENVYFFPEICIFLSSSCPPRLYIVVPTVIILHTYLLDRSYTQHIFWLSRLLHTCDIRVFTHSFNDFTVAASHPEHKYTNTTRCINIWKYDNDTCDWIDYYLKYVEPKSGWGETILKNRLTVKCNGVLGYVHDQNDCQFIRHDRWLPIKFLSNGYGMTRITV